MILRKRVEVKTPPCLHESIPIGVNTCHTNDKSFNCKNRMYIEIFGLYVLFLKRLNIN